MKHAQNPHISPQSLAFHILGLLFDWRGIEETAIDKRYASISNDTIDSICNDGMMTSVLVAKKLRHDTILTTLS